MNDKSIAVTMVVAAALSAIVVTAIGAAAVDSEQPERTVHRRAPSVSAVTFLRGVIGRLAANDYARAWASLDPRQQRLVGRSAYSRCEGFSPIPGRLDRIEVLDAHPEQVVVPGSGGTPTRSIVVAFRLTFAPRPLQSPVVVRVRAHALRINGRWAWMLPAKRLALHRSGTCGTSPPSGTRREYSSTVNAGRSVTAGRSDSG